MQLRSLAASCIGAAIIICCFSATGYSQERENVKVKSGARTVVGSIGQFYTESCFTAALQAQIITAPSNGTVALERRSGRIMNRTSHCFGKPFEVNAIVYRSRPGFRGVDTVKVGTLVFNGRTEVLEDLTITINVE